MLAWGRPRLWLIDVAPCAMCGQFDEHFGAKARHRLSTGGECLCGYRLPAVLLKMQTCERADLCILAAVMQESC